ncbi:MAG: osmoprotectant transporter permease [Acidobacteria bacterium]|nr:osmoprotectant transporter permease [Acidobacteriota bacterium]
MRFWVLWGFDAVVAAVGLGFFLAGLADRSVSSFNAPLWAALLVFLAGVLGGSLLLRSAGHPSVATGLLLVLALPALLGGILLLLMILLNPRWN